jgi:hypothetical protein
MDAILKQVVQRIADLLADGEYKLVARLRRGARRSTTSACRENPLAGHGDHCYFSSAVRENEEVVPVNAVSTWVLPSGVTVGR